MAGGLDEEAAFWRGHVEVWRHSGLSRSAYCREHGLDGRSFHDWAGRAGRGGRSRTGSAPQAQGICSEGGGFVPVLVADPAAEAVGSVRATAPVEIAVGGAVIRVAGTADDALLRRVLTAVRATA